MKTLYLNRYAPNPRKVIILMQAKGLNIDDIHDIKVVDIDISKGEQFSEEFNKINPLQLVPVLVLDDKTVINDSQAICEYLDRVYGEHSLMGNDVVQRAQVCAMRRVAEFEILYNFMLAFQNSHPSKAKRIDQVPIYSKKAIARAEKTLPYFENILSKNDYLIANQLSYADIVFYTGLDFGRVLKFDPTKHGTGIAKFYDQMNVRFGLNKS